MYRLLIILMLAGILILPACKDEDPLGVSALPTIVQIRIAEKWKPGAAELYKIESRISDPQGTDDISTVLISVRRQESGITVYEDTLFDDGAFIFPQDGDVFARDGVFTNRFSTEMIDPGVSNGQYVFGFVARDNSGNESAIVERTVIFSDNAPPVIGTIMLPDTFSVMKQDLRLTAVVTDTNGQENIDRVFYESRNPATGVIKFEGELYDDGDWEQHGDLQAGDSVYSARLDTGLAVGKSGIFELLVNAEDGFGETAAGQTAQLFIENLVPGFGAIDVPESLNRPAPGASSLRRLITVQALDPEGLADVDSVYFFSRKPDMTFANNGLPIILQDNGLPFNPNNPAVAVGDLRAGDGVYSFSLIVDAVTQLGTYRFSFYIRDKAGNLSPVLIRDVNILSSE